MIPTVQQVYDAVRNHLGDTQVAGGQIWTNAVLAASPFPQESYDALYQRMAGLGLAFIQRRALFLLPAYQGYLTPLNLGVTNFGEPIDVAEAEVAWSAAITGATAYAPATYQLDIDFASAHGRSDGTLIGVYGLVGITEEVNEFWPVKVVDSDTIRLLGCPATGAWTSGGTAFAISGDWQSVVGGGRFFTFPPAPQTVLGQFEWTNNVFRFPPCSIQRALRFVYTLSPTFPSTVGASLGFEGSLLYLGAHTAALAAAAKGFKDKAAQMFMLSIGREDGDLDKPLGGAIGALLHPELKSMQHTRRVIARRFRPKRNVGPHNAF